jgi:hypothetical protein
MRKLQKKGKGQESCKVKRKDGKKNLIQTKL